MQESSETAVYQDTSMPTDRRIEDLLSRMTLTEKAAQLGSVNAKKILDEDGALDRETAEELLADGIGHLTRLGGEGSLAPTDAARITNGLQEILGETRLGVPAIPHEECLSGYMGPEGTTFPQGIGMASTWNPTLMSDVTKTIRSEMEAIGTVHALSPVLDVARDLRWGRVEETFGEDPYLVAAMACAYVSGLQGESVAEGISATLKHFVAHGASEGGKNRASVNLGSRVLRETHMFPYEAAIQEAGAESVMNAYHDIDGIPCASSEWLLTNVLRGELGFDGTVVSDYYSIDFLKAEHGISDSDRESGVKALEAGIDVELPYTDCYGDHLVTAVENGELAEETLDTAVRRVLQMKFEKGVFDAPTVDVEAVAAAFGTQAATELTKRAARESIVLLKNEDDLLPLENLDSLAVVGPKADDIQEMMGDYAYPAHYPSEEVTVDATTPLDAIRARADADVAYEEGCTTTGPSTDGFESATAVAAAADVTLAFVGARSAVDFSDTDEKDVENPALPTSGEGSDVTDLVLPGVQQELLEALHETGTPLVVVVVSGKPHALEWTADAASAVVQAWLPGEEGGTGIADVLYGDYNPSGHLPVSFPQSVGQLPVHYNRRPNTATNDHVYTESAPLYPFGHGLSYTDFAYDDLTLSSDTVAPSGSVTATVTVTNTGDRSGHDIVQLYIHAESPDQARPVQELKGFERVSLDAGASKRVSFEVDATQLAYHDADMNLVVSEGSFELRVGHSATEIAETATVEVSDSKRVPRTGRTYFSETEVE
ncbi:glycoside hydrolase family 3 N-terminal domain-containing protein [Haladaptatus pallidirubidus]|uniref:Glycoside hydrolase family 3 N-terminal domain-containing protein n=1 Tax=Haladaptatus pallidirubidus TaxID=1008152 RepID=A0AAV3UND5_9EURY|nr:glycoside hydrolase family 3 N-terminal domain-containing protein [Haladaptatus pallidirubidus]